MLAHRWLLWFVCGLYVVILTSTLSQTEFSISVEKCYKIIIKNIRQINQVLDLSLLVSCMYLGSGKGKGKKGGRGSEGSDISFFFFFFICLLLNIFRV